jgi:pimeloyl-ACP methyl ester carboxylesterase
MLWNIKNGKVKLDKREMNYVSFGTGERSLIFLPGLSDGLTTVKGKALLLAKPYSIFFKKFTVYIFSRKNEMPEDYSIRDMANDQGRAMDILGIKNACIVGVSQGGMIAQYLAIYRPELIDKLVLVVTSSCANNMIKESINKWIGYATRGEHKKLMIDTAEKSYSAGYFKKYELLYPILGIIGKPSNYDRFIINANAILDFDVSDNLKEINCPTLVIGGDEDKVVGVQASYDIAEGIRNSALYVYEGLGHSLYEEAKDFNQRIFNFLQK